VAHDKYIPQALVNYKSHKQGSYEKYFSLLVGNCMVSCITIARCEPVDKRNMNNSSKVIGNMCFSEFKLKVTVEFSVDSIRSVKARVTSAIMLSERMWSIVKECRLCVLKDCVGAIEMKKKKWVIVSTYAC
jgi:hypothetical protein